MSVRKRKWVTSKGEERSAWAATYTDQQGVRHQKMFERKKDADMFHSSGRGHVRAGLHRSAKATVAEAGELWVGGCEAEGLERTTTEAYRQHLNDHIVPFIGAVKLSLLTVPAVRAFMDRLRKGSDNTHSNDPKDKPRSAAMVKRVVGDLGSILADAQDRGLVAQNVVRSLSRRRKRRQDERRQKKKLVV